MVTMPFEVVLAFSELLHLTSVSPCLLFLLTDMACVTFMLKWNEGLVIKYVIMLFYLQNVLGDLDEKGGWP